MAWLESKGNRFRIRFRYGGKKNLLALRTSSQREANDALGRFNEHLRLIDRGIISPPPEGADVGVYIISGGKHAERPTQAAQPNRAIVSTLFDSYMSGYPKSAKEASTWRIEMIHIAHLRRLLDVRHPLVQITTQTMQAYVNDRSKETGRNGKAVSDETIQKEIGTFAAIWNKWGVPQGLIATPAPTRNLLFPKAKGKPPFQTRAQIERQILRNQLTDVDQAELWRCLFLTLDEIEEVLNYVQAKPGPAYVYPMMVFAAHTGARRSEIRRALITDFDFDSASVLIRERKKDPGREETYRTVPMSPRLTNAMRDWLSDHPRCPKAICTDDGDAIADHRATKVIRGTFTGTKWSMIPGWHCFRHSFISNCVAKGVDQRLIDHWVGHTTEEMRRRYSHLLPQVSQAALLTVFGPVH